VAGGGLRGLCGPRCGGGGAAAAVRRRRRDALPKSRVAAVQHRRPATLCSGAENHQTLHTLSGHLYDTPLSMQTSNVIRFRQLQAIFEYSIILRKYAVNNLYL